MVFVPPVIINLCKHKIWFVQSHAAQLQRKWSVNSVFPGGRAPGTILGVQQGKSAVFPSENISVMHFGHCGWVLPFSSTPFPGSCFPAVPPALPALPVVVTVSTAR